ncbi:MAG: hypothetical protein JXJ20_14520 [Anaerolineae bacterium]|jgi:hypothetical protein|nr:hypothetical protein [Anaerolineae bacterium]
MLAPRRTWLAIVCLLLALIAYYLSWFTHETAAFTMNAFDLAEWSSLHPAVRSSSPPMLTSFLLRAPQLALVLALALAANQLPDPRGRWVLRLGAGLLALRFMPPTDFFSGATDDPNYRQMALLAALASGGIVAALLLTRVPLRWQCWLLAGILTGGMVTGWAGLSRAKTLLDNFEIDVQTGTGVVGFMLACGVGVIIILLPEDRLRWSARWTAAARKTS